MATVYLATDLQEDRVVALKVLRPELSGVVGAERFAREIAIARRLQHPHILPIHDSGTLVGADGVPVLFYTMPYVAGRPLRAKLNEESQLSIEEAIAITRQVADALDHAHLQGIIHRDIKPENILLADDTALVADFGIARAADAAGERLTQTGLALGTPAYMSPEQATGTTRLDGRADIYALGCVLYEMLAGEPPFTGPTAQAILARHAMDRVPSLRTLRPETGAGLARVVRRALAKAPADRYPTARAFAAALAAPETERTDEAPASGATRYAPARRRLLVLSGVAALLTTVGALALMSRERRTPTVPLDPAAVAVAPFRVSSSDPALAYLREGIVDLLTTKLGGTIAVQPVDSRTVLKAWHDVGGSAGDAEAGQAMARAVGAGQVVQGEVVSTATRTTLSARLRRMSDGKEVASVTLEGSVDSLTPLVDQLAARLLVRAAGQPQERLPALSSTPAAALRAYLDGWALLRRYDLDAARRKFEEALAVDSTLALAGVGAVRAAIELGAIDPETRYAQLAWRYRDRLSTKDHAYAEALLDHPRSLTAMRVAVDRLLRVDPDNADAWNFYGIVHCDPKRGDSELDGQCRAAYHRAVALDSTNGLVVFNAAGWAAQLGDTAFARRSLGLYLRLDSVSPRSVMVQWLVAAQLGDTLASRRAALSDSMVSTRADWDLGPVWQMLLYYLGSGRGLSDAELVVRRSQAIAATGDQRATLAGIPIRIAVMRGRADGMPTWFTGELGHFERVSDALFADADPVAAAPAAAALERQVGSRITGGCCLLRFMAAQSALAGGRVSTARQALVDIQRYARAQTDPRAGNGELRVWPLILKTQLAAREASPSVPDLLRQLDSVLANQGANWGYGPLYGNLISARLHATRREYAEALAALRRRDESLFWPIIVTYHREEGRIAALAGDTASAIRAYERYLRIRADAEPRLQPQLRQVRAELAALRPSR